MSAILESLWQALNTPAGVTAMAGLLLWLLNRIYAAKPAWKRFEGAIVSAVKFAEKEIPDDTPNKGLRRLDMALDYVLRVYYEATGKVARKKTVASLKEGIQLTHERLEAAGTLK